MSVKSRWRYQAGATVADMYGTELAHLKQRFEPDHDRWGDPAAPDQIRALRVRAKSRLGFDLPTAYERFLSEANGVRIDDGRIFGVDADLAPSADSPVEGLDGFMAFNLDRADAYADAGISERFCYLAWYAESVWCMKSDGTFWEQDPETLEDVMEYHDCEKMLKDVIHRIAYES